MILIADFKIVLNESYVQIENIFQGERVCGCVYLCFHFNAPSTFVHNTQSTICSAYNYRITIGVHKWLAFTVSRVYLYLAVWKMKFMGARAGGIHVPATCGRLDNLITWETTRCLNWCMWFVKDIVKMVNVYFRFVREWRTTPWNNQPVDAIIYLAIAAQYMLLTTCI